MYGALIAGMAGLASQGTANAQNRDASELAYKRQREAEANAYAHSQRDVALENAYNSPSAQMQRLREAGLNPMLAFQSGVNGNMQNSVPKMPDPQQWTPSQMTSDMSIFTSIADQLSKNRELDLRATEIQANNAKTDAERRSILKDLSFKDAIESDRHSQALSSLQNDLAERQLKFATRMDMIDKIMLEKQKYFENMRQFDIQIEWQKQQHHDTTELEREKMRFQKMQNELDRTFQAEQNRYNNRSWYFITMMNHDWAKYRFAKDHYKDGDGSFGWRDAWTYEGIKNGSQTIKDAVEGVGSMVGGKAVLKGARNAKQKVDAWRRASRINNKAGYDKDGYNKALNRLEKANKDFDSWYGNYQKHQSK